MLSVASLSDGPSLAPVPGLALPLLRQIFQRCLSPMVVTDLHGVICHANPAFEAATGYDASELCGHRPSLMQSHLQSEDFYRRLWRTLRSQGAWQGEIWNRHKSGRVFREFLSITALQVEGTQPTHYLGVYAGQGSAPQADGAAAREADVDPVTGVLNRTAFLAAADRLHEARGAVAILALDIEGFTDLNEHFGLRSGDLLLRQVAMRCQQSLAARGVGVLGRVGADEFALAWIPGTGGTGVVGEGASPARVQAEVQATADAIHRDICGDYALDTGHRVAVSVQVGVAVLACTSQQAEDVLLHAAAARQDRSVQGEAVHHYEQLDAQRRMVRALREDIMADRIGVAFQPKVDLHSGRLRGLEALARWQGPDGQAVPPGVFIALAERQGLIAELGDRVFEQVLRHQARWRSLGLPLVPVAVNFSAAQFRRADMAERVAAALVRHGIDAHLIEVELTESILLDNFDAAVAALHALRGVGVGLSIDDFGTGYSSLAYLRRFPVNCLKVDRSFVQDVDTDPRTREIVETVIELAHKLDLVCVAEGVETPAQREALRAAGCDQAQGYLLARPCSADDLYAVLAGHRPWH